MRKIILIFFFFLIFAGNISANTCNYSSKITECIEANRNGNQKGLDFSCPTSIDREYISYQIVLEEKFKPIDEEVKRFLTELEKNKSYYFGSEAKKNAFDAIAEIEKYLGEYGIYGSKYDELCRLNGEIIKEVSSCSGAGSLKIETTGNAYNCQKLYKQNLSIAKAVAYNILHINQAEAIQNSSIKFVAAQRNEYNVLIDEATKNLNYLTRLAQQWSIKIPQVVAGIWNRIYS